jgi:putative endonuclease
MFVTYVLRFRADGCLYTGSTNDLRRRLREHAHGTTRSTRGRGPFEVVLEERYQSEGEARLRETFLKTGRGREELARRLSSKLPERP